METSIVNILSKESGKSKKTISRALIELEIPKKTPIDLDLKQLIIIYVRIDGPKSTELRYTIKRLISLQLAPKPTTTFDESFKNHLLSESEKKDKLLGVYFSAVLDLSNKLVGLMDDISMLRVQDTGTIQRLYDKNVLADLFRELDEGSPEHKAIDHILNKLNK